jgi:anti-anti-sigma regulatory factor
MLRITVHDEPGRLAFQLEGKLAGSWVQELQNCVQSKCAARPNAQIRFDLQEVTYVDAAGKALLAAVHAQGVTLIASGCLMRAIVTELTRGSS